VVSTQLSATAVTSLQRPGSRSRSPLLRAVGLTKSFAGTRALDAVSLAVHSGEVLAVVGQNGSGKSTLVKVLAGIHEPDSGGIIEVRDASGQLLSSQGAHHRSLHFIHQDLGLVPLLSTTENLDLARSLGRRTYLPVRARREHERAAALVGRFGAHFDVRLPVAELSPAERAIVAIARALDGWERPDNILVLDEPTAAFHRDEAQRLFQAVRRVAALGAGVIFISHRLDEVRAIADRVVALRDGQVVAEHDIADLDEAALVRAIVGTNVAQVTRSPGDQVKKTVLRVRGLAGRQLESLDLTAMAGEVLGVTGVLGSGREELAPLIFGAQRRRRGTVSINDHELKSGDITDAIDQGVGYVPADRHRHGAILLMNARENLTLPAIANRRRWRGIDRRAERADVHNWIDAVGLQPPEPDRPMSTFSGGNQQKIVLAKWLRMHPRLLLLDEPTQGVDVGAKATIYPLILKAAEQGAAVIVCSSDYKELATICDRVVVLHGGRLQAELSASTLSEEALLAESLRTHDAH
jgi:ABC-type sugar transport system ATPase subunit